MNSPHARFILRTLSRRGNANLFRRREQNNNSESEAKDRHNEHIQEHASTGGPTSSPAFLSPRPYGWNSSANENLSKRFPLDKRPQVWQTLLRQTP
ncbi:Hypothetical protein NTJ_07148 [Nesidiocoris tenuis]|uniref:Uncharacterized protein n=1 Tax=Nesidiocoris tenuis TaxID=355587 RepID=A0ABN7ASB9_9HEMI|nr:Hypothetical protein NTJ_07148 [Nesidiocoris tenuis]